jgi:hypothetical protein
MNATFEIQSKSFYKDVDRIRRCTGRQGRREGTMSISLGHRAIANAFGWGHSSARRTATHSPATKTTVPAAVEPGELVCSPWEGLYLEQAQPVIARGNEATTRQQLYAFLDSLMYGE